MTTINQLAETHHPKQMFQGDGELWDSAVFHTEAMANQFVLDARALLGVTLDKPLRCQSPEQGKGGWAVSWPTTK